MASRLLTDVCNSPQVSSVRLIVQVATAKVPCAVGPSNTGSIYDRVLQNSPNSTTKTVNRCDLGRRLSVWCGTLRRSLPVHHHRSLHTTCRVSSLRRGNLSSTDDARKFLASLPVPQRECLERVVMEARKEEGKDAKPPSWKQLKMLCYHHTLPFIGFGFLDNFIMITVGEYIDITIGAALTISTMAAAGIGNLISDLAGLGLADQVEVLCKLLGLPDPKLTPAQLQHRSARWMGLLGRCLGITVGCTIGMAPLLWFNDPHKSETTCTNDD